MVSATPNLPLPGLASKRRTRTQGTRLFPPFAPKTRRKKTGHPGLISSAPNALLHPQRYTHGLLGMLDSTAAHTIVDSDAVKIWVAIVAAISALVVAIVNHFSTRSNQLAIQALQQIQKETDAKRDYEYEARKRLYHECGPILFQIAELAEGAYFRIIGLAGTARDGNLEPGPRSYFSRHDYYLLSTLYRLLAPSAALKVLQRRLTVVDLSLDKGVQRGYIFLRQVFLTWGDEFEFAKTQKNLTYTPFDEDARAKSKVEPARYWRQGLPLGVIESSIEALLVSDNAALRVMTYAEFEAEYYKEGSKVHEQFSGITFLFKDFHPRTRPVLWRMLVTQACLYRSLYQLGSLGRDNWSLTDIWFTGSDTKAFDWRSRMDKEIPEEEVSSPLEVAEKYLEQKLRPRLDRL